MRRALIATCLIAAAFASARAQQIAVKAGVTAAPDSVRVGDPFRVTVGIRAPRGSTIEFPRTMDSATAVQSLDPVAVRTSPDTTANEQYADYRVAAWDIGSQPLHLADVIVRYNGLQRRVPLNGTVFVRSVLPADTAQRIPKPPRALFEFSAYPWWLWALLAAAILALGLLIWWLFRRRRKAPAVVIVDPFARAESEFQRIEALHLVDAGERGRHVTLMVEVLRDYLAARYSAAALSQPTTELQRSARELSFVPQDRLIRVLTEADLIKFARRPVSGDRAREIGREAHAIVSRDHEASQPSAQETAA